MVTTFQTILDFWFNEIDRTLWFKKDEGFDRLLDERFSTIHRQAVAGELFSWRKSAHGRLAEIIVLDQFSRNLFRDQPASFAADPMALALAQEAVSLQLDVGLESNEKSFLYMPYMHSESLIIHAEAMRLFDQPGLENNLQFEERHKDIIEQFGRYPHRNSILNRTSTDAEAAFLSKPGSSF